MSWPKPQFSRSRVNKAGEILIEDQPTPSDLQDALKVLNNWRSCHGYPVNTFQSTLRDKLETIDQKAIVAQRLKRIPSIVSKLKRFDSMKLARMQDIGGLRAVVSSLTKVRKLVKSYQDSKFKHTLVKTDNYITNPKASGYRSIHLIYRYKSPIAAEYTGLLLELQIRTQLQHTWATAVETMGTFLNYALKSSEGPDKWLIFAQTGSAFAHLEKSEPIPGFETLSAAETFEAVRNEARNLDVRHHLRAFSIAADAITRGKQRGSYHLIVLDLEKKTVGIRSYGRERLDAANKEYTEVERKIIDGNKIQAVLVSAGPIETLRRAYPNYFLDTGEFIRILDSM